MSVARLSYGLSIERGFLGSGGKGGGCKNDKHKEASGSNEAAIVGKNMVVYVNAAGHAIVNADNSGSGNENANVATTSTQNMEQVSGIVQVSANDVTKGSVLIGNTKGTVSFVKLVTGEPSRKNVNFCTLLVPAGYFSSSLAVNGMDAMLENDPWFIRNIPLILKNKDGLSAIATNISTPLMFDFYNSVMYTGSWGRSSYARAMFELRADVELKDTIVVAISKLVGKGFSMCTIRIQYEWKPLMVFKLQ
ncbi:hypothetical protein Tco_1012228, partial [Tanacetum coccineum]